MSPQTAFYPYVKGKFKRVMFNDVMYIVAQRNYSEIVTVHQKKICVYATLGCIEEKLPSAMFCRIHRSYIVSLSKIEEFDHCSVLVNNEELPMSKLYFEQLSNRLLIIFKEQNQRVSVDL
jgi:two-component system LytT family response regulator